MTQWRQIPEDYFKWLRTFPLVANIGQVSSCPEVIPPQDAPVYLDSRFWSERTHELESIAKQHLSDADIDALFDDVAAVIDEDLRRFDPLIAYFARFFPDGDAGRIEDERDVAHCVKRDLAWAAVEKQIEVQGFFGQLLVWYDKGRWPCRWEGKYPAGHLLVL
ncbi:MAG TPA: hypothetical protein VGM05_19090 [Planctomycetaceae bacterium]|jgi:hypothetical protein